MGLRDDLTAESAARNRRFLLAGFLALAGIPAIAALQRVIPPGTIPKAGVIAISAIFPLGFVAYVIWEFQLRPRKLGQRCPRCGQLMTGYALRTAIDTSRCVRCGTDFG
jgi:hypothetical protein